MSILVTIGSIARGVSPEGLSITHTLFQRSTCQATLPDPSGDIEISVGQSIVITEDSYTHFAGTITEYSRDVSGASGTRFLQIAAVDFTQVCDRRYCSDWTFSGSTPANDIVRFIVDSYLSDEGIDLSLVLVSSGPLVSDFVIKYESVSEALNRLAQQINYYWTIDKDKNLVFRQFAAGSVVATLNEPSQHILAGSLQSRETRDGFANHVTVRVAGLQSEFHDTLTGDGTKQTFILSNWPTSVPMVLITEPGGDPMYCYVGDEEKETFPPQYPDSEGNYPPYSALWKAGANWLNFSRPVTSGAVIEVVYRAKGVGIYDAIDADSINERKTVEGGSGVYTTVIEIDAEKDNPGITSEQAQAIADAELAKAVALATTISFTSDTIIAKPGEKLVSNLPSVPAGTYGVRSVRTTLLGVDGTRSQIEAVSGNILLDGFETIGTAFGYQRDSFSLPVQRDVKPKIPNVDNLTVDASQVEIDGVLKYKLDFSYVVPAASSDPAASFGGVHVYLEDGGKRQDLHAQPLSAAKNAGDTETFTLIMRLPVADTDWKFFVPSRNWHSENVNTWNDLTPNVSVQAKAKPLATIPNVTNFHAGTFDGSTWTAQAYWDDLGSQFFIDWQATVPADVLNWSGVQIWLHEGTTYLPATGILDISSSDTQAAGGLISGQTPLSLSEQFVPASGSYDLIAVSFDRDGNRKNDTSGKPTGPSITVAVPERPVVPGTSVPEPEAPTAVTISVVDKGNQFGLKLDWTPPTTIGGTVGYEREVRYFTDASCTVPDSQWIPLGQINGAITNTSENGPFPRNTYDAWVKGRVRAYNTANVTTSWVESSTAAKVNKTTEAGLTLPTQLSDFSVAVADYGMESGTNRPMVKLTVTVDTHPSGSDFFTAWVYKGGTSAPSDPSLYEWAGDQIFAASGTSTLDIWRYRETAATTLHVAVTTSSNTYYTAHPDGSTVHNSVVIPAIAESSPVSTFNVTVESGNNAGVPSGRYKYQYTVPADPEYWTTNVYRIWCDSTFTPVSGANWQLVESNINASTQSDWWPLPQNAEYWKLQAKTVTKGGRESATGPTANVTVPASTGVDLSKANTSTVGQGLGVSGGKLQVPDASITGTMIGNATISGTNIAAGTITGSNIQNASITGTQIASATVTGSNIASGTISGTNIQTGTITGTNIQSGSITGTQLASATVTGSKIASGTITGTNIGTAVITGTNIASAAISASHIGTQVIIADNINPSTWGKGITVNGSVVQSTSDSSGNLIANGSFEAGLKDFAVQGDASIVTTPVNSGGKAAAISYAGSGGIWYGPIPVTAGDKYIAEGLFTVSAGGTSSPGFGIRFSNNTDSLHNVTGGYEDHWASGTLTNSATWTKMATDQVTVPASYRYMWVLVGWFFAPSTGFMYVDSVTLTKVVDASRISTVNATSIVGAVAAQNLSLICDTVTGLVRADAIQNLSANKIDSVSITALPTITSDKIAAQGDNLLDNPGFESGTTGWTVTGNLPGNFFSTTAIARTGTRSLAHAPGGGSAGQRAVAYSNLVSVRSGDTFYTECWVAAAASDGYLVTGVEFYDQTGTYITTLGNSAQVTAPTNGWVQLTGTTTGVPASAATARYILYCGDHINGPNSWVVDDCRMVRQINGANQIQPLSITAGQIGSINGAVIQAGTISATSISSVNGATIQAGTVSASAIGSVNGSTIQTGTISASAIASVNGATIQAGTISYTSIGSINASTINIGQIGDSQISSMNCSKLTSGTITATISINSPTINGGSILGSSIDIGNNSIGHVYIRQNSLHPVYGTVGININFNLEYTWATQKGFICHSGSGMGPNGQTVAIATNSNSGELTIYGPSGLVIYGAGSTGIMRATAFQAGGNLGYTGTLPAGARPVVNGGIITSYTF